MTTTATEQLEKARLAILMGHKTTLFAYMLHRLKWEESETIPLMATDGERLLYNARWVAETPVAQIVGAIAHELLHCMLLHPCALFLKAVPIPKSALGQPPEVQEKARHAKANMAMDYVVNLIVKQMGLALIPGMLIDERYEGDSWEDVYAKLPDPDIRVIAGMAFEVLGDVLPAPGHEEGEAIQHTQGWKAATAHAVQETMARATDGRGNIPKPLQRLVEEWTTPRVDCWAFLRQFLERRARHTYSLKRPKRRFVPYDLYVPSLRGEEMGPIIIAVDTSGSIGQEALNAACAKIREIIEDFKPESVHVVWADAEVAHTQILERGDPITFEAKGGGGTDFRPAFRYARSVDDAVCMIYLTDMLGTFPEPGEIPLPTLWISSTPDAKLPEGLGAIVYWNVEEAHAY